MQPASTDRPTPGPWTIGEGSGDDLPLFIHAEEQPAGERLVCAVAEPRAEANATLIAAAPELLAAAREVAYAMKGTHRIRAATRDAAYEVLSAAIARAEGR